MKILITLTAAVLTFLSSSAFASDDISSEKMKVDYAVNAYINAFAHGQIELVQSMMASDIKVRYNLGDKVLTYGKADIMNQLKNFKNVEQNCQTDYKVIDFSANHAIVKINMYYQDFTKSDFVNLARTSEGWKITNASVSFINK